MVMVLARASMLFSTNSAMALSGLLCESAMMRIAFQSSPIRNLPFSDSCDLAALVFAIVTIELHGSSARQGGPISACHQPSTISRALAAGQGWHGSGQAHKPNENVPQFIRDDFATRALSFRVISTTCTTIGSTVACPASNTAALLGEHRCHVGVMRIVMNGGK